MILVKLMEVMVYKFIVLKEKVIVGMEQAV